MMEATIDSAYWSELFKACYEPRKGMDAKKIWEYIKEDAFEDTFLGYITSQSQFFENYSFSSNVDVTDCLYEINSTFDELESKVCFSSPIKYGFSSTAEAMAFVKSQLLYRQTNLKAMNNAVSVNGVFQRPKKTETKPSARIVDKKVISRKVKEKCDFCGKKGHIRESCFKFMAKRFKELEANNETPNRERVQLVTDTELEESNWVGYVDKELKDMFIFEKHATLPKLRPASGHSIRILGIGTVKIKLSTVKGEEVCMTLKNACYVPNLLVNIFSVRQLASESCLIIGPKMCSLVLANNSVIDLVQRNGNYFLNVLKDNCYVKDDGGGICKRCLFARKLHRRFGHVNMASWCYPAISCELRVMVNRILKFNYICIRI
ncbi:hypothetical protein V1514DRAFT_326370 [Lipomyces japonicus]|uniref:uncharacterized protein n=1 Tax=Lipomyces japonicus TaxID=56871 RepID=UPI0034CE7C4C